MGNVEARELSVEVTNLCDRNSQNENIEDIFLHESQLLVAACKLLKSAPNVKRALADAKIPKPLSTRSKDNHSVPQVVIEQVLKWFNDSITFLDGIETDGNTIFNFAQSLETRTQVDEIRWRFTLVVIHKLVKKFGKTFRHKGSNCARWTSFGGRYWAIAEELGGLGALLYLPFDRKSIWETKIRVSQPGLSIDIGPLKPLIGSRIQFTEDTYLESNHVVDTIVNNLVNHFDNFVNEDSMYLEGQLREPPKRIRTSKDRLAEEDARGLEALLQAVETDQCNQGIESVQPSQHCSPSCSNDNDNNDDDVDPSLLSVGMNNLEASDATLNVQHLEVQSATCGNSTSLSFDSVELSNVDDSIVQGLFADLPEIDDNADAMDTLDLVELSDLNDLMFSQTDATELSRINNEYYSASISSDVQTNLSSDNFLGSDTSDKQDLSYESRRMLL